MNFNSRLEPTCNKAPSGWRCTRTAYHLGPCAAVPILRGDQVQPGDIIVTEDDSWISRLIRRAERTATGDVAWASHSMIVAHDGLCVNATVPCVNKRPITDFPNYRAYRIKDPTIRYAVAAASETFVGDYYGICFLLLHALGLRRWATYHGTPICSMVVGESLAVGFNMSEFVLNDRVVRCDQAEPNDIEAWCIQNPELVETVE